MELRYEVGGVWIVGNFRHGVGSISLGLPRSGSSCHHPAYTMLVVTSLIPTYAIDNTVQ